MEPRIRRLSTQIFRYTGHKLSSTCKNLGMLFPQTIPKTVAENETQKTKRTARTPPVLNTQSLKERTPREGEWDRGKDGTARPRTTSAVSEDRVQAMTGHVTAQPTRAGSPCSHPGTQPTQPRRQKAFPWEESFLPRIRATPTKPKTKPGQGRRSVQGIPTRSQGYRHQNEKQSIQVQIPPAETKTRTLEKKTKLVSHPVLHNTQHRATITRHANKQEHETHRWGEKQGPETDAEAAQTLASKMH